MAERLGPRGEVWRELDEAAVAERRATSCGEEKVEAVAIALLHSYADDAHERRVEEIVRAAVGDDVYVTRSSEILPEIREYERTSTAVVNAYVGPAMTRYIASLVEQLREAGIEAPLEVMQSSGGTLTPAIAQRKPAHLVESGPAAGVMACSYLGRLTGRPQLISLDMGGTTAKAAIVEDGQPVRTSEYEVGAGINLSSKLVKGGGHPIKLPFIDVSEIGAGGGSIVTVDPLGTVSVGPLQRRRGARARLLRHGRRRADPDRRAARARVSQRDAARRRRDHARRGAVTRGARAARRSTARPSGRGGRPRDPDARRRDDDAGGEGGHDLSRPRPARLHALRLRRATARSPAVEIARALRIRQVLIPPAPGVFSALGLLFSDTEHEIVRTLMLRGDDVRAETLESAFDELEREATANLAADDGATVTVDPLRGRPLRGPGLRAARAGSPPVRSTSHASSTTSSPSTSAPTGTAPPTIRSTSSRSARSPASSAQRRRGTTRWR